MTKRKTSCRWARRRTDEGLPESVLKTPRGVWVAFEVGDGFDVWKQGSHYVRPHWYDLFDTLAQAKRYAETEAGCRTKRRG